MRTKTKKTKQITQIVVSMLLVLTMVFMPMKMILAADAQSSSTPTQFVLVLDCSGSMEESDVNGLSPKAAKMFVDMMPVENAQIAIVAFGANWGEDSYVYPGDTTSNTYTKVILGMTDVGTEKAKKKVKEAIDETAKVRDKNGYTTIGYALQAAKDVLKENKAAKANGCVVLMSDGRQYYLKNGQRGSEAQETKLENGAEIYKSESLEAALKDFKEKKWPVYTLEMSADIKDYYDEAGLHTPKEWKGNGGFKIPTGRFYMQHIADETGGEKFTAFTQLEVQNNFAGIFNKFYEGTEAGGILVNSEIKSGKANMDFDVAEMIAETNITITGNDMSKVNSIELTDPSGSTKKYTETNKTDSRVVTFEKGSYIMVKLLAPMEGKWKVKVNGTDGVKLTMMTVPIRELGLSLSTSTDTSKELEKGTEVTLSARFSYNKGQKSYFSKEFYGKNPAKLYVVKGDEESAQTFDMTVDEENQCYTGKVILNQTGMVKVKAVVESGHFRNDRKETGYITFNVKNRPVTKVKDLEDLNMGFGEEQTIDLNTYFNDPDQDKFICNFEVDQTAGIEVTLDEQNVMHIKTGTKAGDVQVKVGVNDGSMDQDVTSSFTIHMVNQPLREKGSKKISKTITYNANKVPGFLKKKLGPDGSSNAEIKLDDYFEDPDGAAPIYEIEKLPESSKIQINESAPGVLSITATGEGKETFHVSATDANDGSIRFEKEISVKSISAGSWVWKQIRVPIIASVIILVIVIVFLILMFAGRKIYGVWEITVGGRLEGPYPLGKMAHGKKAKCSLSGAIEDFGFSSINDGGITLKAGNNFNKSVTITGLEKAATVTYAGREYDTAAGKTLKKAKISKGQYIDIYVDGVNITLTRMN